MKLAKKTINIFNKYGGVKLALQFGSSVTGGQHPGSDVDIGLAFADFAIIKNKAERVYHDLLIDCEKS